MKSELLKLLGPNPLILDIGAYDGRDSYEFAELGATVHSFEPLHINRLKMRAHENITVHPFALGRENKAATFHTSNHAQSSSLNPPKEHLKIWPNIQFYTSPVQLRTLDSFKFGPIALIWADVNGAEEDLILGAEETLKTTQYLFIETSNKELYSRQINTETLMRLLPDWTHIGTYNEGESYCNILLKNESCNRV